MSSFPQVMDKEGARLTTYRFTSPSGGVFSYTVENDSEPGGGVEEMEVWEAEEASRDMWKKASRQQVTSFSRSSQDSSSVKSAMLRSAVVLKGENIVRRCSSRVSTRYPSRLSVETGASFHAPSPLSDVYFVESNDKRHAFLFLGVKSRAFRDLLAKLIAPFRSSGAHFLPTQTAGTQLLGAPATGGAVALHVFMEVSNGARYYLFSSATAVHFAPNFNAPSKTTWGRLSSNEKQCPITRLRFWNKKVSSHHADLSRPPRCYNIAAHMRDNGVNFSAIVFFCRRNN